MTHLRSNREWRKVRYSVRILQAIGVLALIVLFAWLGMAQATTPALQPLEEVTITLSGSDFYIPRPVQASDQVGVPRLLDSYDLEANGYGFLVGSTCTIVSASADNGESVHENNYGLLVSNGDEVVLSGTESEPNVTRVVLSERDITLGSVIQLFNIMQPDGNDEVATSVDYVVVIRCVGEQTTTTTTEGTTTSTEETTTTEGTTTTTSGSSTTTTEPLTTTTEGNSTTTLPPSSSTSSSTTVPNTSTTEIVTTTTSGGSTSTTGQSTTSSPDTTVPLTSLPRTGTGIEEMLGLGVSAILFGALLMMVAMAKDGEHEQ